ncbi:hypothetical protein AGMMS50267_11580 [Spirochaetia bacterium]|nr:hypothetical protein AGMMS50267_11580 [Spirochaetia bacterium]
MGIKMNQKVNEGSTAYQANGAMTVNNGMTFTEVRQLFEDLFERNFPRLVDAAAEKAQENLLKFYNEVASKLKEHEGTIDFGKFTNPNTQYLLSSTITDAARTGNNLEFLSEALVTGLRSDSSEMLDIITEQALGLIPRLTNLHINTITLNQYIRNMRTLNIHDFSESAHKDTAVLKLLGEFNNISMGTIHYITSLGIASYINVVKYNEYESVFKNHYPDLYGTKKENEIKTDIEIKSPSMKIMFDVFETKNVFQLTLNPVGQLIALINLKKVLGNLDYSIWIK